MSNCYGNCKALIKRLMKDELEKLSLYSVSCKCEECLSCRAREELKVRESNRGA